MVSVMLHFPTLAVTGDNVFGIDLLLADLQCISIFESLVACVSLYITYRAIMKCSVILVGGSIFCSAGISAVCCLMIS